MRERSFAPARALQPSLAYWVAMYAASALGTNLGDYYPRALGWEIEAAFAAFVALTLALIALDRVVGRRTELLFWIALVVLRAVATNLGDALTHLGVSRVVSSPVLGVLTLTAGYLTLGETSPRVDARYWAAMGLGGVFGTVAGDWVSHVFGLPAAAAGLAGLLVVAVAARSRNPGAGVLSYWALVLVERAAGTPAGDLLAEGRGLGLGLPVAMAIAGTVFVLAVAWRSARPGAAAALTAPAR